LEITVIYPSPKDYKENKGNDEIEKTVSLFTLIFDLFHANGFTLQLIPAKKRQKLRRTKKHQIERDIYRFQLIY